MAAKFVIERSQQSLDYRTRPQHVYQKRSQSVSNLKFTPEEEAVLQKAQTSKRQKSISVCYAMLPSASQPRTIEQYEQFAMKNGFPQSLAAYELKDIRVRGLSTSEIFNEPPGMYVYQERPVTYAYMKREEPRTCVAFVKKRKHTLCAWAFGIIAITLVMTIIIIQMKGDFG